MNEPAIFPFADAIGDLDEIRAAGDRPFTVRHTRGTMVLELYAPRGVDDQQPHTQDELYIVASGSGTFYCDGARVEFAAGDALFAAAGVEHRFEDFTDDFATWVIFYGPEGGEIPRVG